MAHEGDPNPKDPDIKETGVFIGALVAIALVMTGIYFFADMHAVHVASDTTTAPVTIPAPEPATPPPSTLSR